MPWAAVASVGAARGSVPDGKSLQVDDGVVTVPVMKQTRVQLALHPDTTLDLPDGPPRSRAVRLYADDARGFVAAAREYVPAATS